METICRCGWCNLSNPLYVAYHDREWGVPQHDDEKLFELLILESFQAGLSWETILNKREAFRAAFDGFDPKKVAAYGEEKAAALLENQAIVRNRRKIAAAVQNAKVFLEIREEWGSFSRYIWRFTDGTVVRETGKASSPLSDRVSADLKKRGMTFVGTTIVYAYLQAIGVIDSHDPECFLHREDGTPESRSQPRRMLGDQFRLVSRGPDDCKEDNMIKNQENAIEEETIVIVLDPEKLENPDLDLRYDLPARIETATAGAVRNGGYDYIDLPPDQPGPLMGLFLRTGEPAAGLWPKVLELLRRERFLGNDLSQSAEIYISPGPRAELADCVRVYPV